MGQWELLLSLAAYDHGVPKTALHNHINGRVVHGINLGSKPYLNFIEEKELRSYLKHAKNKYGKTRDVLGLVQTEATEKMMLQSS